MFEKGRAVDNPMISLLLGASCSNIKNTLWFYGSCGNEQGLRLVGCLIPEDILFGIIFIRNNYLFIWMMGRMGPVCNDHTKERHQSLQENRNGHWSNWKIDQGRNDQVGPWSSWLGLHHRWVWFVISKSGNTYDQKPKHNLSKSKLFSWTTASSITVFIICNLTNVIFSKKLFQIVYCYTKIMIASLLN